MVIFYRHVAYIYKLIECLDWKFLTSEFYSFIIWDAKNQCSDNSAISECGFFVYLYINLFKSKLTEEKMALK